MRKLFIDTDPKTGKYKKGFWTDKHNQILLPYWDEEKTKELKRRKDKKYLH